MPLITFDPVSSYERALNIQKFISDRDYQTAQRKQAEAAGMLEAEAKRLGMTKTQQEIDAKRLEAEQSAKAQKSYADYIRGLTTPDDNHFTVLSGGGRAYNGSWLDILGGNKNRKLYAQTYKTAEPTAVGMRDAMLQAGVGPQYAKPFVDMYDRYTAEFTSEGDVVQYGPLGKVEFMAPPYTKHRRDADAREEADARSAAERRAADERARRRGIEEIMLRNKLGKVGAGAGGTGADRTGAGQYVRAPLTGGTDDPRFKAFKERLIRQIPRIAESDQEYAALVAYDMIHNKMRQGVPMQRAEWEVLKEMENNISPTSGAYRVFGTPTGAGTGVNIIGGTWDLSK